MACIRFAKMLNEMDKQVLSDGPDFEASTEPVASWQAVSLFIHSHLCGSIGIDGTLGAPPDVGYKAYLRPDGYATYRRLG